MGYTINLEIVEHAFQTLALEEFRRAYLNIMTAAADRVIPLAVWMAVCDPEATTGSEFFAIDCNPERSNAAIVAVGKGPVVEVVEYRPGVGWLVDRVTELARQYHSPVVIDKTGPAGSFIEELARREVEMVEIDATNMTRACGNFYDLVMDGQIKIRSHSDLNAAVASAMKRPVGDAWAWGRKTSNGDISLLVAATLGVWAATNQAERMPFLAYA